VIAPAIGALPPPQSLLLCIVDVSVFLHFHAHIVATVSARGLLPQAPERRVRHTSAKFYTSRWSLLSATNDISTGHLDVQRSLRTVKRDEKRQHVPSKEKNYSDARAVGQQIECIMAEQNAQDFQSTFSFLQTVEKLCCTGEVRKLADAIALIGGQVPDAKKPRQETSEVPASPRGNMTKLRFAQSARRTQAEQRSESAIAATHSSSSKTYRQRQDKDSANARRASSHSLPSVLLCSHC